MTRRRKIAYAIAGTALTPVVLFLLLVAALYIPAVQNWAIQRVAEYASEQTGLQIRLQRIRIKFPLDIDLQQLSVTTPPDTILAVRHAIVDLDLSAIFHKQIGVEAIDLREGIVDTRDLVATVVVKGDVGNLHLRADQIFLDQQRARINGARLDGCNLDIALRDTTVTDTTESAPIPWRIEVDEVEAHDSRLAFHTVGDSLCVRGGVRDLVINGGNVNLEQGIYQVGYLLLDADSLSITPTFAQTLRGIRLETHDLLIDEAHVQVPQLSLSTPSSLIEGNADLEWAALSPRQRGRMDVDLQASIGRADLLAIASGYLSPQLRDLLPEQAIEVNASARGNVDSLSIRQGHISLPPYLAGDISGSATHILSPDSLGADIRLDVATHDLQPIRRMLGLDNSIRLPQMTLKGEASWHNQAIDADLLLTQGRGKVLLKGKYNTQNEEYKADLDIRNLNIRNFLPRDSIGILTARAHLNGRGTDLLSRHTRAKGAVDISHLQYGNKALDDIRLTADVRNGEALVNLSSANDILIADACATLQLDHKISQAQFSLGVNRIDLYALGLTQEPHTVSMFLDIEGNSNLSDSHQLTGHVRAIELALADTTFYPTDMDLSLLMMPDTIFAQMESGDLEVELASSDGLEQVMEKLQLFGPELERQFAAHVIQQDTLKALLPRLSLRLRSGQENTLAHILRSMGYTYDRLALTLDSDPDAGLNGNGHLHSLNTGAILLDTIQWRIFQDTTNVVRLDGRVRNGPRNKQVVFESNIMGQLTPSGANASISFLDAKRRKGVDLGAELTLQDDGYRLHLSPLNPIIAYRRFTLNEDNYIYLHDDKRLEADIDLLADDGTGFKLYSTPNANALQDITLSVHDFNLGELAAVLPYMPEVGGKLAGDFHLVQDSTSMSVLVDAGIDGFSYEKAQMGHLGLNAVYLPNADGTHYVDGIVSHDGSEVMTLAGTYDPKGEGTIDAQAALQRLPLSLANGFIPDDMFGLRGYVTGNMDVRGPVSNPILDGAIATDSMHLASEMYSLDLRFPNDTIQVTQSHLDLRRIEAYSIGKNPLVMDGTIDFQDLSRILLNLNLSARDFELINAPKSAKAVAYGKVFVNIGARLSGTLNDMLLRGRLDVLGNTDVTYVLTDSPLTVDDHLAEIVTFVDFSDTLAVAEVTKTPPQNIDMQLDIDIEQAAQVHCLLSLDGTNHLELEGGGDLTMTYTTQDGLQLYGRYTIVSGLMNYTLMVMSLKNFTIQNGSYAEFSGDILNPRLNIKASERVKTTVYENNVPRSVNFDVGLAISQTLNDMGLEFTLAAPSDLNVSNQLATMSQEERGKVAVTMLATGMYLTESGNGTSGFSATNALNSFLQTQIANISNRALSTIDLNFGIDNTNTASGGTQTDYSFSFAKRFWGNRISLIIGGKVSAGSEATNNGEAFINNVSLEYRLDKSATRYVRIYYDRDTESLLEDNIMEMGAGIVLRRKSSRLGELFIFRRK